MYIPLPYICYSEFEPLILTKTGEVSDVHKLQKTIISHIIGTKCCNFLSVYQNDSGSDYYWTNGFHLDVRVYSDNEHTDDFKMW